VNACIQQHWRHQHATTNANHPCHHPGHSDLEHRGHQVGHVSLLVVLPPLHQA
jgi:hypothetical protein